MCYASRFVESGTIMDTLQQIIVVREMPGYNRQQMRRNLLSVPLKTEERNILYDLHGVKYS